MVEENREDIRGAEPNRFPAAVDRGMLPPYIGAPFLSLWDDFTEAFPAFMTVVAPPLTFSIATGLSLGLLSFTFRKVEISPLIWILSVLFLCRYAFLGSE